MSAMLAAILLSAAGPAALPTESLHTPDQIASAVLPYLACLYAARGLPLLRGTDGRPILTDSAKGGDCSAARGRARQEALKLLVDKPPPDHTSPEKFVDETLSNMDSYVASLPKANARSDAGDLPIVEATPVAIEDEVQPAYTRYNSCLRAKVKESPVTAWNVLTKFSDALDACRQIRASSLKEAKAALSARGWDGPARQRAAENTFAKADQSWTTMGRQLHEALVKRELNRTKSAAAKPSD